MSYASMNKGKLLWKMFIPQLTKESAIYFIIEWKVAAKTQRKMHVGK